MRQRINKIFKYVMKILRWADILFFVWILIRIFVFKRDFTAVPYAEPIELTIDILYLLLCFITEKLILKLENNLMKKQLTTPIFYIVTAGLILLYSSFLWENVKRIYLKPHVSVQHFWDSGQWKW